MVLEDLIWAGNYTMGETYDNFTNYRRRMREKSIGREHVSPIKNYIIPKENTHLGQDDLRLVADPEEQDGFAGTEAVSNGSLDVASQRGHRPEDNPAFRDPGITGDVTSVGIYPHLHAVEDFPDEGPASTDEEGNPIEPQEAQESFEQYE
jgi:hypothetical protein